MAKQKIESVSFRIGKWYYRIQPGTDKDHITRRSHETGIWELLPPNEADAVAKNLIERAGRVLTK